MTITSTTTVPSESEVAAAIRIGADALADHALQLGLRSRWGATTGRRYAYRLQLLYLVLVALQSWINDDRNYLSDAALRRLLWTCETLARSLRPDAL